MTAMSDYLENAIINATLRGQDFVAPPTVYLALFTSDPTDAGTGTEVSGGGYTRQPISFGSSTDGSCSNVGDIFYPAATAGWGTISHIGIYDAGTAGNLLYYGSLITTKSIAANDQLKVAAGDITVTLA